MQNEVITAQFQMQPQDCLEGFKNKKELTEN